MKKLFDNKKGLVEILEDLMPIVLSLFVLLIAVILMDFFLQVEDTKEIFQKEEKIITIPLQNYDQIMLNDILMMKFSENEKGDKYNMSVYEIFKEGIQEKYRYKLKSYFTRYNEEVGIIRRNVIMGTTKYSNWYTLTYLDCSIPNKDFNKNEYLPYDFTGDPLKYISTRLTHVKINNMCLYLNLVETGDIPNSFFNQGQIA